MRLIRRLLTALFLASAVVLLTVVEGLLTAAARLDPELLPADEVDDDTLLRIREGLVRL